MAKYFEVLARPKFARFQDFLIRAEALLAQIETKSIRHFPKTRVELIADDPDNRILELAEVCNADFIITGNTNDFTFPTYKQTKIVTPKEYWDNCRPA